MHLGGHLSWYDPQKRSRLEIRLAEPTPLLALLQQLGIPPAEIAVAAVNGAMASVEDAQVSDEDRLELLPPVGGGSGAKAEKR